MTRFRLRPAASMRPLLRAICVAAAIAARSALGGPFTDQGTQPNLTHGLIPPSNCEACHAYYDKPYNIEPFDTWAGTMMAQAARDPLFWASLDVANHDLPGVGDFCLRCHSPVGWLGGRSEPPGGTEDGCGLLGKIDERDNDFAGITCHLCHRMMINPSPPPGEEQVYYENGQFWLHDDLCPSVPVEPCRFGPYDYPAEGTPPDHAWQYSSYLVGSGGCGNCHDVSSPAHNLIVNGNDMGVAYPIERTYSEWLASDFADEQSPDYATCQNCHMPDAMSDPAYACILMINNHTGNLPVHVLAGGNPWVPDVIRQEYPNLGLDAELMATRDAALDMLQNRSAVVELFLPDSVLVGAYLAPEVKVTNLTGHKLPTGYPEGRRMWIHLEVRDGTGALIWETGAYDAATGVLTEDPQIKVYEARPGIWDLNGTGDCDVVDGSGNHIFHFVLNNCYALDNRIPPLGFTGGNDPEVRPVGYTYPETSPGSGVLVNHDTTRYLIRIPPGTETPLIVTATLVYQTASKELVEFLRDEAVENGFPDDCIERTTGFPGQSRGEILYDMWQTYGRVPPVAMGSDAGTVTVYPVAIGVADPGGVGQPAVVRLAQNVPNPLGPAVARTRIAYQVPVEGRVRLEVFDVTGRGIRTLVDAPQPAGDHVAWWDGRDSTQRAVASGVYLYRLAVDGKVETRRMIVLQ